MERDLFHTQDGPGQVIYVSRVELAMLYGVTTRLISHWTKQGMPKAARDKYDLGACVRWREGFWKERASVNHARDDSDEAKRKKRLEADILEIELSTKRGEMISITEVRAALFQTVAIMNTRIEGLPARLAMTATDITDHDEMRALLNSEAREIQQTISDALSDFSRAGNGGGAGEAGPDRVGGNLGESAQNVTA